MTVISLILKPMIDLTKEKFLELCLANPDAKLELTSIGELVVMSPTGGDSGIRNSSLNAQLWLWNQQSKKGFIFDSSTMFELPLGGFRSPDAAWIVTSRWETLTVEQKKGFPPICPDFVVELRSPSDSLKLLQEKMQEYINNSTELGWLIDPENKRVEIYRQGQEKEVLQNPICLQQRFAIALDGENVLSGLVLDLTSIWL